MDPYPSSLILIPMLTSHSLLLVSNLFKPVGQDARSTKLLVSPSPSGSPNIESPPSRLRSSNQAGHLAPGSPPSFTMLDSDFLAMKRASLAHNPGLLQVRTKMRAQHAAVELVGSRKLSSIKCVVDSTLLYTTPNDISLQVQDPPPPPLASQPVIHQESIIPALSPPAIGLHINNQRPVLPVEDSKSRMSANNPYVNPPVRQLVVNKTTNTIHFPEDAPTRDCYGWDPMLDGEDDDSNSNQDSAMPDALHGEISGNTWKMMDQQFTHPTHASVGKDCMGLEDTLNDVL